MKRPRDFHRKEKLEQYKREYGWLVDRLQKGEVTQADFDWEEDELNRKYGYL